MFSAARLATNMADGTRAGGNAGHEENGEDGLTQMLNSIPRGRPKSGRTWKTTRNERHSAVKKDKPLKSSWQLKMQQRADKKLLKSYENELKNAKQQRREHLKKRREQNKQRKLENARKAEVVQPIKNTAKIKRMRKKQLRQIEKR